MATRPVVFTAHDVSGQSASFFLFPSSVRSSPHVWDQSCVVVAEALAITVPVQQRTYQRDRIPLHPSESVDANARPKSAQRQTE